jgi:hypothetical protein
VGKLVLQGGRTYRIMEEKPIEAMRAETPRLAADMEAKGRVAWVTFRRGKGGGKWCAGWRLANGEYHVLATALGR